MSSRFYILAMILVLVLLGANTANAESLPNDQAPDVIYYPSQIWISYTIDTPTAGVSPNPVKEALIPLVGRVEQDYKDYNYANFIYGKGSLDVRLSVDEHGIITGVDVLSGDVSQEIQSLVQKDLQGNKLSLKTQKSFIVKLSLFFNAT